MMKTLNSNFLEWKATLTSAHVSDSVIEQIQFEKRLKFCAKKCELLAIGSDDAGYTLDASGRTIKHVSSVIGDLREKIFKRA